MLACYQFKRQVDQSGKSTNAIHQTEIKTCLECNARKGCTKGAIQVRLHGFLGGVVRSIRGLDYKSVSGYD
jgi:hypothetical protein